MYLFACADSFSFFLLLDFVVFIFYIFSQNLFFVCILKQVYFLYI